MKSLLAELNMRYFNSANGLREIFLSEVSFTINLDLNHMPQSFKEWAKIINQGKFKIKPKNLKFGTVYVAGRLGNSWGGMTIVKKS